MIPALISGTAIDTLRLERRWRQLDLVPITQSRPGIRIVELPSTRLRIRVAGSGSKTLVFIADPPNIVEQYDQIIDRLGQDHRIVIVEQPGMGFSFPKPGFGFTLPEYVQALGELLQTLQLGPYVVIAPCTSAFTALHCAAAHPEMIEGLVLMQATDWTQQQQWGRELAQLMTFVMFGLPTGGSLLLGLPVVAQALSAATERWFPHLTTGPSVYRAKRRPDFDDAFMAPHKWAFAHGACNCQVSVLQRYFEGDDAQFPTPRQPALVLFGNKDVSHDNARARTREWLLRPLVRALYPPFRSDQRGLLKYVPLGTFIEVDETGHFLELENPEAVCTAVAEFVSKLPTDH